MRRNSQRGSALLVATIIALVLGLTCAALVIATAANSTASQNNVSRATALTVAEIGVERAKALITAKSLQPQFDTQGHQAVAEGAVLTPDGDDYGSYSLHVTENYANVDGQYRVISLGTIGRVSRQTEVVICRSPAVVPDLLGAINLYNPNSLANFSGTPPHICGLDTNIPTNIAFSSLKASDCTAGSGDGPDALGVAVHDNPSVTSIISSLGNNPSRVEGSDGSGGVSSPSVYNVMLPNPTGHIDTLSANDIVELADEYAASAEYVYDAGRWVDVKGQSVSGNFGTMSAPKVVSIRNSGGGTLHLNGTLAGVGLLVIDCDVQFGGTFNYAGLIVITNRGNATVDVDMRGTPLVLGSMVAANPGSVATTVLDLRGTADVFYSRQGLALAQKALANNAVFKTKFYAERKPDESELEIH